MNYQKIYDQLIETRKNEHSDKYCEDHHIIPKCLGGSNEKDNIVRLTYREHYLAHYLLTKIHPTHSGIQYGFLCMLRKQPTGERMLSSKMYDTIKRQFAEFKRWHCKHIFNPGKTEKSRNSARKRMTENNPNQGGASNHTAYPVRVYFNDGTTRDFEYMKQVSEVLNVSYASVKTARRKNIGIPKYNIDKIVKL